jgi:hypothetical protein
VRADIGRRRQPYAGVVLLLTVFSVLCLRAFLGVLCVKSLTESCGVVRKISLLSGLLCGQQRVILVNIRRQRRAGRDVHVFAVLDQTDRTEQDC